MCFYRPLSLNELHQRPSYPHMAIKRKSLLTFKLKKKLILDHSGPSAFNAFNHDPVVSTHAHL